MAEPSKVTQVGHPCPAPEVPHQPGAPYLEPSLPVPWRGVTHGPCPAAAQGGPA